MIISSEILDPILSDQNPPKGCPVLDIKSLLDFARGFDTTGEYRETPDGKSVTCTPVRFACNENTIHPACKECGVANTPLIDMREYRQRLGLRY